MSNASNSKADEESEPETKKFRIDPAYSPQSLDSDDEETIREEEARGEAMTRDEELALLQKELDTPLEDLLKMYEQTGSSPEPVSPPTECQASPPMSPAAPPSPNLTSLYSAARGESDESDEEYKPLSKFRTEINVGPGYQAEVPDLCRPGGSNTEQEPPELRDQQVWNPQDGKLTEEQLEKYTEEAQNIIRPYMPDNVTSAVEMALDCLNKNNYDAQAALNELKLNINSLKDKIKKNDMPFSPGDKEESVATE